MDPTGLHVQVYFSILAKAIVNWVDLSLNHQVIFVLDSWLNIRKKSEACILLAMLLLVIHNASNI